MEKEQIELLRRIYSYLTPSMVGVQCVYKTPAQQMREGADQLERQEKDIEEFDKLIRSLTALNRA